MKKLDYEKIESADESLRHLKFEPKANLQPRVSLNLDQIIDRRQHPKPILFIQVPIIAHEAFHKVADHLEQKLLEIGWFLLWTESHVEQTEYKIQSFTLQDPQELQVQKLKEIILNEIKGK